MNRLYRTPTSISDANVDEPITGQDRMIRAEEVRAENRDVIHQHDYRHKVGLEVEGLESRTAASKAGSELKAKPNRLVRWRRALVFLAQTAAALFVGYWYASVWATPDTRVHLPDNLTMSAKDRAAGVPVTAAVVSQRPVTRSIEAVGNLFGYDEVTLKTKLSGRVARVLRDFADRVKPGELLLEIDPTDAQLAVEQAKSALSSELAKWGFSDVPKSDADLTQLPTVNAARLKADQTKSQYARLAALQSRGSVSAEEVEQAKTNLLVGESDYSNQLLLARSGVATAQLKKAELDIAEQQLLEANIFAPDLNAELRREGLEYTITERYVSEGAFVATGTDLFRLVIDDRLKLRLSIPEKHAADVRLGQRVEVSTLTSAKPVVGTVSRIGASVDSQTRTFQIEAEVDNTEGLLKTGGFAKARVINHASETAQTVPVAALVTFAGVHKIFLLQDDLSVEVHVRIGQQTSEWIEIVEPRLPPDAMVIVSGHSQLADGSQVVLRSPAAQMLAPGESL